MAKIEKLKALVRISLSVLMVGIMLMTYMITVESELGALPLLLVFVGIAGYLTGRYRLGKQTG